MAMLGSAGAVAIAYFLAARLGLALLAPESDVAVFWPAAGIAAGIAINSGRRTRLALVIGVVVGTIAADLTRDERLLTTLYSGLCDAGEAVLIAWLLERRFGRPFRFSDLRRLAGFLVASALATAACAMCGAAIMTLLQIPAPYWDVWQVWFLSDWVGIVAVAPLVIGLGEVWRRPPSQRECIEGLTLLVLTATACFFTMTQNTGSWLSFSPGAFVLPLLLWLVARCQLTFGIAGAFFASVAIILDVTFGVGRFGDEAVPLMERIRGAQVATTVVTLFTLVLGVLFAQRKMAEDGLAKERAMLARLHEVGTRLWLKRDLSQALDEILAGAIELLRADMGAIRILDTARGMLKIEAQRGFSQEYLKCFGEVSAEGGSPCCRAVRSIERIIIEDVEADTLFIPFRPMASAGGYRALQSTPIINREGTLLGTLATHFRSVHKPEMQDLSLLDLYVRQAAEIVERHNAEEALRESEERLRLAQLRTGIGIWDFNLRTGKLTWTPELEALFGLKPGTVKCYRDYRDRIHPEDVAAVESARVPAVRRRETYQVEYRIIRPDGQIRWIAAIGGAVYDEATGKPTRIIGNNADITERKLAELALAERNSQLTLAGKSARVGWFVHDVETEGLTVSEGYNAIHGLPEGTTETTLRQWRARVHPDDLPQYNDMRSRTFGNRRQDYMSDYRIIRPDGEVRWIESRGIVTYDSNGQPKREIGINIDVTDSKRIEEHQSKLVAELDHRVKNTLATVSAVVDRTQQMSSSMAEFAVALNGRIKSMAMAQELLSRRRWQGIPLAELVRRELAPYATASNTRIDGPDVVVSAEAGQILAMVFHELVTNAAKFGAISVKSGRVFVRWSFSRNGHVAAEALTSTAAAAGRADTELEHRGAATCLCIYWEESGGPRVEPPSRSGFGTSVVRELVPYELGGTVDLAHLPKGVRCALQIPTHWLM
jgi:PAS domain S-box-containing protein